MLAAGGIGITALVAMGKALKARGADYRFVYGARSRSLMAFVDELVAEHGDRMELHIDAEGTGLDVASSWRRPRGRRAVRVRPHADARRDQGGLGDGRTAPAGPAVRDLRQQRAVRARGLTVRIPRLGLETVVSHDVSMLEALEACGADMMFDCRRGECGLCQVKVLGIEGVIDHRDVFLSDDQHQAGDRLQSCVSRVVSARTGGLAGADGQQAP